MRVLLLEMPQLLRGMFEHAIELHGGCEVMEGARRELPMLTARTPPPDAVILGLSAAEDAVLVSALFACWPMTQVITVMQSGDVATLYQLSPSERQLGELSPAEIVEALRDAAHKGREV